MRQSVPVMKKVKAHAKTDHQVRQHTAEDGDRRVREGNLS
jgi:hypothetical protein